MTPSVLVVDDEPSMRRYLSTVLELDSYRVETAANGMEALERVGRDPAPDLVLLDLLMPGMDGLETLERLGKSRPGLKVMMLSCVGEPKKVVRAIQLGAKDYLTKPFQPAELHAALRRCLGGPPPAAEVGTPDAQVEELGDGGFFLAASPVMRKIAEQAKQVAKFDVPVLLLGESGTGKEVVSRLIHKHSARADQKFLKVNCTALPDSLLESELFGYEAGAFTGATRLKPGKFEFCNKGTLLLDEIGDMPATLQAKLLHVLQDKQFSRLGGRSNIKVDVRILAATNIDVQKCIANKSFREDLFYRLNTFTINLPPLRERKEDIPLLLTRFMARMSERYAHPAPPLSPKVISACLSYHWPGNLRELENFAKRYLILGDEDLVIGELSSEPEAKAAGAVTSAAAVGRPGGLKSLVRDIKSEAEAEVIARALEQTNWSRKEAARVLDISYKALLYKVRQYGIDRQ